MFDMVLTAALYMSTAEPSKVPTFTSANVVAARAARQVPAEWVDFTECVSQRESGDRYEARNPTSSAQGRYQFLDRSWRYGGSWNVFKRLVAHGYDRRTARFVRLRLASTEIARWRPVYQDVLYAQVLTSGEGQGWRHWFLAGSRCNGLVPR
jgi:hypothetical protein